MIVAPPLSSNSSDNSLYRISVGSLKRDPRCPHPQRSRPPRRWLRSRSLTCLEESSCQHHHHHRWVESRAILSDSSPSSSHAAVSLRSRMNVLESLFSTWTLMPSSQMRACHRYHRLVLSSYTANLHKPLIVLLVEHPSPPNLLF